MTMNSSAVDFIPAKQRSCIEALLADFAARRHTPVPSEFRRTVKNAHGHWRNEGLDEATRQASLLLAQCALAVHEHQVAQGLFRGWEEADFYRRDLGPVPEKLQITDWKRIVEHTSLFRRCTDQDIRKEIYPIMEVPVSEASSVWGILDQPPPMTLHVDELRRLAFVMISAVRQARG